MVVSAEEASVVEDSVEEVLEEEDTEAVDIEEEGLVEARHLEEPVPGGL